MLRKPLVLVNSEISQLPEGDTVFLGEMTVEAAKRLEVNFVAGENLPALRAVYSHDDSKVYLGDNSSFISSKIVGLTLNATNTGDIANILIFGVLEDSYFNSLSSTVGFLTPSGIVGMGEPDSGNYIVRLGYTIKPGSFFIKVEEPILT